MSVEERVRTVVGSVVEALDPDAEFKIVDDGEVIKVDIDGPDMGQIIGRHGNTLDAIQHIAYRAASVDRTDMRRVEVDAGGWRERRAIELREIADDAADEAIEAGQSVSLEPMSASERRVVHEYLREREDVDTTSEGREPERYLVVEPLED
ncbi:MAG: KH domain-containing protein [Solirubrobacterales bacterium]|nr:KH domain-containing protein [Solirubrobacterales bacterium]